MMSRILPMWLLPENGFNVGIIAMCLVTISFTRSAFTPSIVSGAGARTSTPPSMAI